mmetsp:Transcript_5093/g.12172  ORF Transcript_5093/g.12172 Transcript_5093/m.12172 type:complete len:1111 (-) Transcript_5093:181-3513(-)
MAGLTGPDGDNAKISSPPKRKSKVDSSSLEAQAAGSLALLLREDPLLTKHKMHMNASSNGAKEEGEDEGEIVSDSETDNENNSESQASFSYAAALLLENKSNTGRSNVRDHQQQAEDALGEVDRKLALVESLAERVSRTSPEAVAGPLLRLHGHVVPTIEEETSDEDDVEESTAEELYNNASKTTTLVATRDRCDRLKRQGNVLEGVASRVETSLTRGLTRMEKATNRLSRVLQLSATLKMILRLQFEASKLESFMLDDLRDLTRAAASVAVIEDLLAKPELERQKNSSIDIVEAIRPQAIKTAAAVREAAAALLSQQQEEGKNSVASSSSIIRLGATLQVYYHLGELPQAAWSAVNHALEIAEFATNSFWSPTTLSHIQDTATSEAKISASSKKLSDSNVQRALKNKLKEFRARTATQWADDIYNASIQVWNLQQVLVRKSDPVSRQVFRDVVAAAPVPEKFRAFLGSDGMEESDGIDTKDFSIFKLYWDRLCQRMGERLKHIVTYENGKFSPDVAALYPATRSATLNMLASLQDTIQAAGVSGSTFAASLDETPATSSSSTNMGMLGGSAALDDSFLQWSTRVAEDDFATGGNTTSMSADSWTVVKNGDGDNLNSSASIAGKGSSTTISMSAVFNSQEWLTLQGNHASQKGLFRMQMTFLKASSERLCAPLQYMFAENVTIDDMGNAISHLPLLPSKYDIQRLDALIRQELAMADPREGGGELSAVTMIAENIVQMIAEFCARAENGVSKVGEDGCLASDGSPTDALTHDMKVTKIMYFMSECLQNASEKVFLDPYRPAVTHQLEEASSISMRALLPARKEIDNMVNKLVLQPLARALNKRVARVMGRMHQEGAYLNQGGSSRMSNSLDEGASSFVQKHLSGFYDSLFATHLQKLPPPYSLVVGISVSIFSVYTFVSTASLIRPMGEDAKMQLTQDLADFELVVDQFMTRAGGNVSSKALRTVGNGKPYAELRAVRQMLFWTGLEDKSKAPATIAKTLSREVWVRDIRSSTVCHYLFSFAPDLLSSPHHWKRLKVEEYVGTLVSLNGDIDEGESLDWMTTMACCDSFKQRESAQSSFLGDNSEKMEGDSRIAAILMALGPELLQRRRS